MHVRFGEGARETAGRKTGAARVLYSTPYVSTWQGFVYVAFVIDVFAR